MGELIPIVAIVMGMLTVLIPITGFTARQHVALLEQRVALLEQQQSNTEADLEKLLEVQQFQEKLLSSGGKET
jgi:hypothetical protein